MLEKHFGPESNWHYHFGRQKVKISYSCTSNVGKKLTGHNRSLIHPESKLELKGCNCPRRYSHCFFNGHCQTSELVYGAKLKYEDINPNTGHLENVEKIYSGLSSNTMKSCFNSHQTTFRHESYATETALSEAIWKLKRQNLNYPYTIEWFPQKLAKAYNRNAKRCDLCWSEKTFILYQDHGKALYKHTELHRKCLHYEKHRLMSW